jgi:hypothetical protein
MVGGCIKRRKSLYETAVNGAEGERRWDCGDSGVMEVETSAKEDEQSPGQDTTQGEETKKIEEGYRIGCRCTCTSYFKVGHWSVYKGSL